MHCQVKHFVFRSRVNFHPKEEKKIPPPNNFPMGVTFEFSCEGWRGGGEEKNKKCEKIVLKTIYFEQFKKSFKEINVAFPNLRLDQGRETETHREREKEFHD